MPIIGASPTVGTSGTTGVVAGSGITKVGSLGTSGVSGTGGAIGSGLSNTEGGVIASPCSVVPSAFGALSPSTGATSPFPSFLSFTAKPIKATNKTPLIIKNIKQ